MRKNKGARKNIAVKNRLGGVYAVYSIKGLNLDRFINNLKNKEIALYDVKKPAFNQLIVAVSYRDSKKLFAFAKEMCYNIKKVQEKGPLSPLLFALRKGGVVIGLMLFSLVTICLSNLVYEVRFEGTGSVCKREILTYLESVGVKKFTNFSKFDKQKLEDEILACYPSLSFVSLEKRGNLLVVNSILSTEPVKKLDDKVFALYSSVSGVIESVKVYRGTAVVSVGDRVKEGDLLVDGFMLIKEQTLKTNVYASVTIVAEQKFNFIEKQDNKEQECLLFALSKMGDKQILSWSVEKIQFGQEFIYEVTAKYRAVINTG